MKKYRFIFIIALHVQLASCSFLNPAEGTGEYMEKTLEPGIFKGIEVDGIFQVELVQSSSHSITFKGGDHIFKSFKFSNHEQLLHIQHQYSNWFHDLDIPTVEIHCSDIEKIHILKSSNVNSQGAIEGNHLEVLITEEADIAELDLHLNYNSFRFQAKGTPGCKVLLQGNCLNASYTLNGSTNIHASEFQSQNIRIGQNGLSDAHIWATDSLHVTFYNSGNVYFKGDPHIEVKRVQINNQKATGQLIPE